jgi:hypothetical protein
MSKNTYNLCNREERKELFCEYLVHRLPKLSFSEFEENIEFLCNRGLSNELLIVDKITIDKLVCPIRLKIGKIGKDHIYTQVRSLGILDLFILSKCLKVFDDQRICNYVRRLNIAALITAIGSMTTIIGNTNNVINAYALRSSSNDDHGDDGNNQQQQGSNKPRFSCDPITGNPLQSGCPHAGNGPNVVCHPVRAGPVCCTRSTNLCTQLSS